MKQVLSQLIREMGGDVIFQEAVSVKTSPHTWPIFVYGASTHKGRVSLFDGQDWHELEEGDRNYMIVANSVYQRLQSLKLKTA
jgi:hypothetical protein